eukprot:3896174-Rhodomonas_salina.3
MSRCWMQDCEDPIRVRRHGLRRFRGMECTYGLRVRQEAQGSFGTRRSLEYCLSRVEVQRDG